MELMDLCEAGGLAWSGLTCVELVDVHAWNRWTCIEQLDLYGAIGLLWSCVRDSDGAVLVALNVKTYSMKRNPTTPHLHICRRKPSTLSPSYLLFEVYTA